MDYNVNGGTTMLYNDDIQEVTVDEYELHEWLCSREHFGMPNTDSHLNVVDKIRLKLKDPELAPPGAEEKWQAKVTQLLQLIHDLDAEYHDDMEHTC